MNDTDTEAYLVTMTRVSDGKVVEFEDIRDVLPGQDTITNFDWSDGNHSCDCNRHLCFHRDGLKEKVNIRKSVRCGEGMYKVVVKNIRTGEIILEEK